MKQHDVRQRAFAMPLTSPAFPPGPYRFVNREYMIITYRTDPAAIEAILPEPLQMAEPVVRYEFIRMPDSTGFGDYSESGQVIPVTFGGERGSYTLAMFLDDQPPLAGGRELWGFPKKAGKPRLEVHQDTLVGSLDFGPVRVATGTMGYKYETLDQASLLAGLAEPNFLLKIIPHVDGTPRICELVRYHTTNVAIKGAWCSPGSLELHPHALAPVSALPVLEVLSARHFICDLTLDLGTVAFDYLQQ